MKKLFAGCGCMTMLIVIAAVGVLMFFRGAELEPLELETIELTENLIGTEQSLELPEGGPNEAELIRLDLDTSHCVLTVVPDAKPGEVKVSGEYDRANYELDTRVVESNGVKSYLLVFEPKKSFSIGVEEIRNELVVHIPRNQPLDLEVNVDKGGLNMDLTGAAVHRLDADLSMGRFDISMARPNPIQTERLHIENSLGDLALNDLQNFRIKRGHLETEMSNSRLYNSGPMMEDSRFTLEVTMGEIYLQAPDNALLQSKMECSMGSTSTPNRSNLAADAPVLELEGECLMGGIQVTTGRSKPKFTDVLLDVWVNEGIDATVALYNEEIKPNLDEYQYSRHSLRGLGYEMLELDRPADALVIFEINAREYPDYEKSWRALGAAHYELGQYEDAYENLKRALDIDPEYKSAKRLLRKVERKLDRQDRNNRNL